MNTSIATAVEPFSKGVNLRTLSQSLPHTRPHKTAHKLPKPVAHKTKTPWSISTRTLTGEALIIRSAVASDAAALAAIGSKGFAAAHQAAIPEHDLQGVLASSWSETELASTIANHEIQTLVAEVDQQIVGLACLDPTYRPTHLPLRKPVELGRFYVHLDWVGVGVGSALMMQALRQATMTNYSLCWLRVWQGNKNAIHFYRRWGFMTISAGYYTVGGTLVPVWVMIHTLATHEVAANKASGTAQASAAIGIAPAAGPLFSEPLRAFTTCSMLTCVALL